MLFLFRKTDGKIKRKIKVQCFPLYSVLKAIGNPKVDYFSLDIEGSEFQVCSIKLCQQNLRGKFKLQTL